MRAKELYYVEACEKKYLHRSLPDKGGIVDRRRSRRETQRGGTVRLTRRLTNTNWSESRNSPLSFTNLRLFRATDSVYVLIPWNIVYTRRATAIVQPPLPPCARRALLHNTIASLSSTIRLGSSRALERPHNHRFTTSIRGDMSILYTRPWSHRPSPSLSKPSAQTTALVESTPSLTRTQAHRCCAFRTFTCKTISEDYNYLARRPRADTPRSLSPTPFV